MNYPLKRTIKEWCCICSSGEEKLCVHYKVFKDEEKELNISLRNLNMRRNHHYEIVVVAVTLIIDIYLVHLDFIKIPFYQKYYCRNVNVESAVIDRK